MNARNARMIRDCSVPEGALVVSIAIASVVAVIATAMPSANAPVQVAGSPIDAQASAVPTSRMPAPAAQSAEGNVVDLTY